ncbi:uncharacterized protein LOC123223859 [Mangifera indica]|uniref:uncharacterized protein LOC123223859 n=1 Tax=Mangifera indica TaxID=29780 RepID=UPI001CF9783F|nr:uncharacterized protein LOC123223859 [Mangifera indica]
MDFELRSAREKLEKEQKERKEKARLKLERERKAKEEAKKQRDAIEAAQRSRRLDAIDAQLKAEQEVQENLLVGGGIAFYRVLEVVPYRGSGDKIKLPPSCFTELSGQGAFDKGPLHFKLSVVHQEGPSNTEDSENWRSTHAGVLEFTADEGFVGLPSHVWSNLFPTATPKASLVEVRYVQLPKGTYAKLKPDGLGFSELPSQKAVLETSLRQHATLSQGDVLTVNYGALEYKLQVLDLKPSSSISVLETDIEVDIVNPDAKSEGGNQYVLKPLVFGKSESGMVDEGNYLYYKFSIDDDTWEKIVSGEKRIEIKFDTEIDGGDTNLYVSRHPLIYPSCHQHEWSSHDVRSKVLILSSKDKNLGVGAYSIGVCGFKDTTKFRLLVTIEDNSGRKVGQQATSSSSSIDMDAMKCRNCNRFIPSQSIVLHEAYCSRHSVVCQHASCGVVLRIEEAKTHVHCEKCGEGLQQGEMEKHLKVFHEPHTCLCGIVLDNAAMVQHKASGCPLRLITCQFCGDMVQAGSSPIDARDRLRGLSEHESICGSRTAPCDSCGRAVMLKDMDIHQIAVHQKS